MLIVQAKRRYHRKQSGYDGQTNRLIIPKKVRLCLGWVADADLVLGENYEKGCVAVGVQ